MFDDYHKNYYPKVDLNEEEFDDLFSPIINSTKTLYKKLIQTNNLVNMYEAFVILTVFSEGRFETKL